MKNIREIITDLNVARSNSCSKEKSEELKKIINDLLPHEKQEKALDTVKSLFRLKGNCLQIYCPFADNDDNYMFVKELETEEELNAWKEVLYAKGD